MKERRLAYNICKMIYKPLVKLLFRPKVYGKENIPNDGNLIFAGNHKHAVDPTLVMGNTKRFVHYMAKEEVSKGIHGLVFRRIGTIIVYKSREKNISSVIEAENILNNGGTIGIFPEGTRNRTQDELLRFKTGTVRLAIKTNAPIVPFAIRGKYRLFRKGLEIEFGKPINVSNMEIEEANNYLKSEILNLLRK